jgi:HD-GYP domain-containing protein (c-di-GMP phosphodiesterase class II)
MTIEKRTDRHRGRSPFCYVEQITDSRPAEEVRAAELAASLSLAIDYGMGSPLEQGMYAALVGTRLAEALNVDRETARAAYYTCLMLHVTCTTDAYISASVLAPGATTKHIDPFMFGSPGEQFLGVLRAVGEGQPNVLARVAHTTAVMASGLRSRAEHFRAICEVGPMISARLGLPSEVGRGLGMVTERWDGKGIPNRRAGPGLPVSLRIAHLARDACFQSTIRPSDEVVAVIGERAGHAFDPEVAEAFLADPEAMLDRGEEESLWELVLSREPQPHLMLEDAAIDDALAAFGDFADLASPCLSGHSAGVADLAARAARRAGWDEGQVARVRRAGWVHDVGGVAVWADIWSKPEPLTRDEREQVRLHPYYTQQVLLPSPFTADLDPVASHHHEALDGSGYHRGESGDAISPLARLLAAADAFHVLVEPRHGRPALGTEEAAQRLRHDVAEGRLDADCVAAVLEAAGEPVGALPRPAGLTRREVQVVTRLARGLATKQIARDLDISVKTADRHIQNAYSKMGVSNRPAATLFAMQHGLLAWGDFPIGEHEDSS